MKLPRDTHVCVIGAGVCGLVSVKACLEAGFSVTCFDKSPTYGGLWCYRDDRHEADGDFIPSVMRTTVLNTSKELSAFSDFPPPAHLPNFMKHNLYMDYIRSYVDHFRLAPHLKLRHEIVSLEPELATGEGGGATTVRWSVEVHDLDSGRRFMGKFDRVMVAVGHHNIPHLPALPDHAQFRGQIIHAARIKDVLTDERLINKRVVVIGFGNSACDAANDIALVSDKCYVSSHRGNWFVGRLTPSGVYEFELKQRWTLYRTRLVSKSHLDKLIIKRLRSRLNHDLLGLTPKHAPSEQVPIINDTFPLRVFTGGVVLKRSVRRLTEEGVVFEGEEDTEYKADVVLLATGYQARLPFMDEHQLGLKSPETNEYQLYLNMFAPKLRVAGLEGAQGERLLADAIKSLAFIGLVQPAGSITVISELQARLAALVFAGKRQLPSVQEMLQHHERSRAQRATAIRSHSRDQLVGDWVDFCDEIAAQVGAKPNMSRLFFKDFALWKQLMFGPSVPYQYRLSGPGAWCKARETILGTQERVEQGINEGKNHLLFQLARKSLKEEEEEAASEKQSRKRRDKN